MTLSGPEELKELTGRCACGGVRFHLKTDPMVVHCCHCRFCQRMSGSAFGFNALIERERLELEGGLAPDAVATPSYHPDGQVWRRCPKCQVPLWSEHPLLGPKIALVRIGAMDNTACLTPDLHCFTASRLPWVTIPDGVPAFEGTYDPRDVWSEKVQMRLAAVMNA